MPLRLARGAEKELFSVGGVLVLAIVLAIIWPGLLIFLVVALLAAAWGVLLWFFRHPPRAPEEEGDLFISPADGQVVDVELVHEPRFLNGPAIKIGIFMSLFDVHVNRAPMSGRVAFVQHVPGRFLQAFRPEAAEVNEHNLIGLETHHGRVLVKQISGILARRIVCWVNPGQELYTAEPLGVIKFGSRVEVYLPEKAVPTVVLGEHVYAGRTTIARPVANGDQDDDEDKIIVQGRA
jgi:phosphatidylserine decarboxylase